MMWGWWWLADFRKQCEQQRVPILSVATEEYIKKCLVKFSPRKVLEIGTAVGYSACMISKEIASYGGLVYTFEIGYRDYLSACHSLYRAHSYNTVPYHADFLAVDLSKLWVQKIDMILVDGRKNQYKDYILKVSDIVAPDGVIIIDDAIKFAHKTTLLYEYLSELQIEYKLLKLDEDDGIIIIENAGLQLNKLAHT